MVTWIQQIVMSNRKKTTNISYFFSLYICVCMLCLNHVSAAQSAQMHLFAIKPDWNEKEYCGGDFGFKPAPINSPSISYSGMRSSSDLNQPSYNCTWQQRVNAGNWEPVSTVKGVSFIPSFYPPLLYNNKAGSEHIRYSWRLLVDDVANGGQHGESDIYSILIASNMLVSYSVTASSMDSKKINIDLNVAGGLPVKKFQWVTTEKSNMDILTSAKSQQQNLKDVADCMYQVEIRDGGCLNEVVVVNKKNKNNNNSQ